VESARIESKLDSARMAVTERAMLQTRIQTVLGSLDMGVNPPLYTKRFEKEKQDSLVIIFDNGIDPDPNYSGSIMGRLFIDDKKNLTLASWPLNENKVTSWRTEILLKNVKSFELEFLERKQSGNDSKKEVIKNVNKDYVWRSQHMQSQIEAPCMVRLKVQSNLSKKPLQFAFHLSTPLPLITYEEMSL